MFRESLFRSGLPILVASVCISVLLYLAVLRRERLARYWAIAWTLLLARYSVSTIFLRAPGVEPPEWSMLLVGALRVAFAGTVLAGAYAIRGRRLAPTFILTLAVSVTVAAHLLAAWIESRVLSAQIEVSTMAVLLALAVWELCRTETLPRLERIPTAGALGMYAIFSTSSPLMPSGSALFTVTFMGSLAMQLFVCFGLFASFFRLSHNNELTARAAVEQRLTLALGEFVSVCMHCKAVRDDSNSWQPLERFASQRSPSKLSHGVCPTCAETHYAELLSNE